MLPLLTIDIGNTTTTFVLFINPLNKEFTSIKTFRTEEIRKDNFKVKELNDFLYAIGNKEFSAIVSSVVPEIDLLVKKYLFNLNAHTVIFLNSSMNTIITIDELYKKSIGSDRIANMAGAFSIYKTNVAVADFGTATTISIVNKEGRFIASCIMPGLEMMFESLYMKTSKLPLIKIDDNFNYTCIDTESAIKTGVIIGTAGAVERILKDIEKVNRFKLKLLLTGGCSSLMSKYLRRAHLLKTNLIFEGLRLIYLRNYYE
ncbi:MAG: type III pantothenate kinase [Thermodesulfovibrionales bacterium]|nr:type III pantothenate kinase [Thermodesulfovibrionales bacterium]